MTTKVKQQQFKAIFECSLTQEELREEMDAPLAGCYGLGRNACLKMWGNQIIYCPQLRLFAREVEQ